MGLSVKILKSGPLRVHFQHSGAKIRVFEQKVDIISPGWGGGGEEGGEGVISKEN